MKEMNFVGSIPDWLDPCTDGFSFGPICPDDLWLDQEGKIFGTKKARFIYAPDYLQKSYELQLQNIDNAGTILLTERGIRRHKNIDLAINFINVRYRNFPEFFAIETPEFKAWQKWKRAFDELNYAVDIYNCLRRDDAQLEQNQLYAFGQIDSENGPWVWIPSSEWHADSEKNLCEEPFNPGTYHLLPRSVGNMRQLRAKFLADVKINVRDQILVYRKNQAVVLELHVAEIIRETFGECFVDIDRNQKSIRSYHNVRIISAEEIFSIKNQKQYNEIASTSNINEIMTSNSIDAEKHFSCIIGYPSKGYDDSIFVNFALHYLEKNPEIAVWTIAKNLVQNFQEFGFNRPPEGKNSQQRSVIARIADKIRKLQ